MKKNNFQGKFVNDLARIEVNDKWGFIDLDGNIVIPIIYSFASNFFQGKARIKLNSAEGYIDTKGILEKQYQHDFIKACFE